MPVRHLRTALLVGALLLTACGTTAAAPPPDEQVERTDPPGRSAAEPLEDEDPASPAGAEEVSLVADLGALPDGVGRAVVTATWVTDGAGTVRFRIDTPAGRAEAHVVAAGEHWWWLPPDVRASVADAEWVRFDVRAVEEAGGSLPAVVAAARQPPPRPEDVEVGDVVAGREVLAIDAVGADEVHLSVVGVDRAVVLRRRSLPASTTIEVPADAVDAADLPEVLRW